MHVCIDEDTHPLRHKGAFVCVPLEKRAPSKSIKTKPDPKIRQVSQEPRRPRFSFFCLHNVKELTSITRFNGSTSREQSSQKLANKSSSGYPAPGLALSGTLNSGSETRSASSAWRVVSQTFPSVNTLFSTSRTPGNRNSKTPKSPVLSRACFSLQHLAAPPSSAMGGL